MIEFFTVTDYELNNPDVIAKWINNVIVKEGYELGEIGYIFCDDEYLHKMNLQFLNHDTLTDIISFDNTLGKQVNGEIYISVERVRENAQEFDVSFEEELKRVIIHGVLHFCGYKDKTKVEEFEMRAKEDESLEMISN